MLFPQFVPDDWREVKRAFVRTALARRIEQLTGAVLVGLGLRLAIEKG